MAEVCMNQGIDGAFRRDLERVRDAAWRTF
jgi:hypothetical protein